MTTSIHLSAALALMVGMWGLQPSQWTLAAQSASSPASPEVDKKAVATVNGRPITEGEIEQRARFLALSANVGAMAKEGFQRLVTAEGTENQLRALQQEVIRSNPGKSREELVALFRERQKQFGLELQKQALESARAALLPKLRKDAKEELIDERLKLQEARGTGIDVSDDRIKALLQELAGRNKMTYEQFARHLRGMGVDIATVAEKFRAQKAWRDLVAQRYRGSTQP